MTCHPRTNPTFPPLKQGGSAGFRSQASEKHLRVAHRLRPSHSSHGRGRPPARSPSPSPAPRAQAHCALAGSPRELGPAAPAARGARVGDPGARPGLPGLSMPETGRRVGADESEERLRRGGAAITVLPTVSQAIYSRNRREGGDSTCPLAKRAPLPGGFTPSAGVSRPASQAAPNPAARGAA